MVNFFNVLKENSIFDSYSHLKGPLPPMVLFLQWLCSSTPALTLKLEVCVRGLGPIVSPFGTSSECLTPQLNSLFRASEEYTL